MAITLKIVEAANAQQIQAIKPNQPVVPNRTLVDGRGTADVLCALHFGPVSDQHAGHSDSAGVESE
ncbi:hypothetical protein D3C86_2121670 [compost metagenome]